MKLTANKLLPGSEDEDYIQERYFTGTLPVILLSKEAKRKKCALTTLPATASML